MVMVQFHVVQLACENRMKTDVKTDYKWAAGLLGGCRGEVSVDELLLAKEQR